MPGGAHARDQLAHSPVLGAVLSPMRGTDAERETMPRSGDVEQPLPDARRKQHRVQDSGRAGTNSRGADDPWAVTQLRIAMWPL
jgi:hypothetical protein